MSLIQPALVIMSRLFRDFILPTIPLHSASSTKLCSLPVDILKKTLTFVSGECQRYLDSVRRKKSNINQGLGEFLQPYRGPLWNVQPSALGRLYHSEQ